MTARRSDTYLVVVCPGPHDDLMTRMSRLRIAAACLVLGGAGGIIGIDSSAAVAAGCSRPSNAPVVRLALSWSGKTPTVVAHKGSVIRVRATTPKDYGDTVTYPEAVKRSWAICRLTEWRPSHRSAVATFLVTGVPSKPVVFSASCQHPGPTMCIAMFGRARIHPGTTPSYRDSGAMS